MHVRPKAGDRWLKNRAVGVANESRELQGLPVSCGSSVILVVVDRLTKYAHFGSLPGDFDAHWTAFHFINMEKPSTIEVLKYCFTSQDGEPTTFVFEIETRYNTIKSQQTQECVGDSSEMDDIDAYVEVAGGVVKKRV
ncbi:unnamed protein product [Cuscuta campestris]|uniref:Uncharacterized protein n=1 Tax=Cuscuta campestris TaxID=132261 RepID=A0A484KVC1_9ASTE|nr:unnamed protein product [Cuscuta campestris]